jgi:hypothetical protein
MVWAMGRRSGCVLLALMAFSVAFATQADGRERVLARWTVTVTGSVRHSWSLPDSEPCQATGSGSVSAHFASARPERITIADNGFGPGDISWDQVFHHISGTITAVDGRTRNPPDPGDTCDTSDPVPDTRACGSRRFHTGLAVESPLGARRRYVLTDNGSFTTPALNAPEGVQDCERDGFQSFAFISGAARPGAEDLTLPRYPSDAALGSRHGRIVVVASQTRRFVATAVTVRRVRLVFTRVA